MVNLEFQKKTHFKLTNIFQENLISTSNSSIIMIDFQDSKLITKARTKVPSRFSPHKTRKNDEKFPGCFWSAKGSFNAAIFWRGSTDHAGHLSMPDWFGGVFSVFKWQWCVNKISCEWHPFKMASCWVKSTWPYRYWKSPVFSCDCDMLATNTTYYTSKSHKPQLSVCIGGIQK